MGQQALSFHSGGGEGLMFHFSLEGRLKPQEKKKLSMLKDVKYGCFYLCLDKINLTIRENTEISGPWE